MSSRTRSAAVQPVDRGAARRWRGVRRQIDALDIARGGVDRAVVGYMETFVVRPESLVLIGTKILLEHLGVFAA